MIGGLGFVIGVWISNPKEVPLKTPDIVVQQQQQWQATQQAFETQLVSYQLQQDSLQKLLQQQQQKLPQLHQSYDIQQHHLDSATGRELREFFAGFHPKDSLP